MIKTTIPVDPFDQFQSPYEEDNVSIDYNEEVRSILVYIGLITVILFFLLLIFSLISKCLKMFNDETITKIKTTPNQMNSKQCQSNFLTSKQTSTFSVSSASFLMNYQPRQISSKPSLSATIRMLQYKEQQLASIANV